MAAPVLGLSPADLTGIREALAAGKRPRVVFTARAGQMAGNAGHVVELSDQTGSDVSRDGSAVESHVKRGLDQLLRVVGNQRRGLARGVARRDAAGQ